MAFALGPKARAAGHRLVCFDTVGSTNAEALARARAGEAGPLWLAARRQTAGRGRRGRGWESPPGNLAASLLRVFPPGHPPPAALGFVAGIALVRALDACLPAASSRLALKWPNDVLCDGAKLAGILLESERLAGGAFALAIGIGVNIVSAPDLPGRKTARLADLDPALDAETLMTALGEAWIDAESVWDEGRGLPAIRDLWLARAAGLSAPIAVQSADAVIRGIFETIDEEGRLVVRLADGSASRIASGDVHFGNAAGLPADPTV